MSLRPCLPVLAVLLALIASPTFTQTVPVSDDFTGTTLNSSLWTFTNPLNDASYSVSSGQVRIALPGANAHDIWSSGNNAARIMQTVSNQDFEVMAKMDSPVTAGDQMQGILVEQSATVFLRFDLRRDGTGPRIFAASISGPSGTFRIDQSLPGVGAPFWLKVKRTGNTWTESYSTNGVSFTTAGTFSFTLTVARIGLFAGNYNSVVNNVPAFTAAFDYFYNTAMVPSAPDLTIGKTHAGNFTAAGTGSYAITVSIGGGAATAGTVTVTDTLPPALTATAISGAGWSCTTVPLRCTRSDVLGAAASYPVITLTVSIASNAPASVSNLASVSGGGETNTGNDSATDPTTITGGAVPGAPVSDDFGGGTLNPSLWTIVNPMGDATYAMTGTQLRLSLPAGVDHDVWTAGNKSIRAMQAIGNVDFQVVAKFDTRPSQYSQMQGLLAEQDSNNYLRLDFYHDGTNLRIFSTSFVNNSATIRVNNVITLAAAPVWLRLNRTGNTWTGSWSADGTNFTTAVTFTQVYTISKVGPFAANSGNPVPAWTALVDYFYNTAGPGGGDSVPDLTLTKSHSGTFLQGGAGSFVLTAQNVGTAPSTGNTIVMDTLPAALIPGSASGTGWVCSTNGQTVNCTFSASRNGGTSYPSITLPVTVGTGVPASVTNTATVSGGGEFNTSNDSASDTVQIAATAPPVISNVSALPSATSADISWKTDLRANSRVDYGLTPSYGLSATDPALVTNHRIHLASLACQSTYNYKVTSADSSGSAASSQNATFLTGPCSPATSDNFDSPSLNSFWTLIDPANDSLLMMNGRSLIMGIPQGATHTDDAGAGNRSLRIVQSIPNEDFDFEIALRSPVAFLGQIEGLLIEQDATNYLRFELHHDGTSPRLETVTVAGGGSTVSANVPLASSAFPLRMRVQRQGDTFTQSWSTDGVSYTTSAVLSRVLTVRKAGPIVGNEAGVGGDIPAMIAVLDYFMNRASPVSNASEAVTFDRFVIDPAPPVTTLEKVLADIDGDGYKDAVIGFGNPPNSGSGQGLAWYEFPHSGNPANPWLKHIILASGVMYEDAIATDLNGDGSLDIIASFENGTISWFENPKGHGGNPATDPWTARTIGTGTPENNMLLADIDGDGKVDLVTNAWIFFQNSASSWTRVAYNRRSFGVSLLDIGSGAGSINLIGMSVSSPYPFVWLENPREHGGNARRDAWIEHVIGPGYDSSGNAAATFATADVNGDGRMDLVTGYAEGAVVPFPGSLLWWEAPANRRNGAWIKHVIDPTYTSAHKVQIADMDGNGTPDIVSSEQEQTAFRRVSIFYNNGAGQFSQQVLSSGSGHNQVAADANGDGHIDILNAPHGYFGAPNPIELYRARSTAVPQP